MRRKLAISMLVVVLLVAGAIVTYALLPMRYLAGESLSQATVFWNDKEAFVFLNVMTMGQAQNVVQQKIASSQFGFLMAFGGIDFTEQRVTAYHLLASGRLDQPPIPQDTTLFGTWKLVDDKLQLTTSANRYRNLPGFRWDGAQFEAVPPQRRTLNPSSGKGEDLSEDDPTGEEDHGSAGRLDKIQRKAFKDAGWHYKFLTGYQAAQGDATLPIALGDSKFDLVVRSANWQNTTRTGFDFVAGAISQLELSGGTLAAATTLWQQNGWREIPKADYQRRIQQTGRTTQMPSAIWVWLVVILAFMVWKVWMWGRLIFTFTTVKGRVLKNVPTAYSFPPAVPAQFPLLDTAALERYTRDFEGMGFARLIDTSPTTDAANVPASFCRVLVHTRHHCFGEISQLFPRGKSPMAVKCSIKSHLQDGWSIAFSDRKPLPSSHLIRRPKALGVNMPEGRPAELLQSLLMLRQQVCFDLGLSPLTEDSLESYVAKAQQAATDMRAAVKQRSFLTGIPQFYYRKLALMKTKPEYVWLGDYPKLAEQRKQTYGLAPAT